MWMLIFIFSIEGCNEIIFNPLIKWWRHGPISRQLRTFVWSNAPIHYKIGMMSCTWMQLFFVVGCRTLIQSLSFFLCRHVLVL